LLTFWLILVNFVLSFRFNSIRESKEWPLSESTKTAFLPLGATATYFALTPAEPSQLKRRNLHQGKWLHFFHFPV
jgi:hypothetical protein